MYSAQHLPNKVYIPQKMICNAIEKQLQRIWAYNSALSRRTLPLKHSKENFGAVLFMCVLQAILFLDMTSGQPQRSELSSMRGVGLLFITMCCKMHIF